MADAVKSKVAADAHATESEVIRDGLRILMARDRAVENWLRGEVAETYDALKVDRSQVCSCEQGVGEACAGSQEAIAAKRRFFVRGVWFIALFSKNGTLAFAL